MKAVFFFLFFSLCIISRGAIADHDIHLSVSEIRYNEESSSFEVAVRIFIDDLEKAIAMTGASGLKIGTEMEHELADEHIASYLSKHFIVEIDGQALDGNFIGKEVTEDLLAVWCYIEFQKPASSGRKCVLTNHILFEVYGDQRNIMDIKMSKTHKDYAIFERGKESWGYLFTGN